MDLHIDAQHTAMAPTLQAGSDRVWNRSPLALLSRQVCDRAIHVQDLEGSEGADG